ncbi:hypothetical protein Tco_0088383 [Tanacetum coccineum]
MNCSLSLHQSHSPLPPFTMNSINAFSSNPSKKIKLTIIHPRQQFVNISSDEDITTTPSPTTTSLSLTHPNAPSKTTSTNQTSSSQENTSSSFHSKLQISPPSSHEPISPPYLNPLLDNILDERIFKKRNKRQNQARNEKDKVKSKSKTLSKFFKTFFRDTSVHADDNTNVVNAPREPIVVNQDPDEKSSPSPPHIDHCCHECGDSLGGIFCRQCTCKFCGKGAHYGYNCPPKVPIISNPELPNNQTIDELPQSVQQQCLFRTCQQCGCNEYDGVCFYCKVGNETPINFSTPYSSNDSPSVANHPPQSQYVPYSCELCGNDSHYGYDCPPQVPFGPQCMDPLFQSTL